MVIVVVRLHLDFPIPPSPGAFLEDERGQEHHCDVFIVDGIEGLFAQESNGLEFVGRDPGLALVEDRLETGPFPEQPFAAQERGLKSQEQRGGTIGIKYSRSCDTRWGLRSRALRRTRRRSDKTPTAPSYP